MMRVSWSREQPLGFFTSQEAQLLAENRVVPILVFSIPPCSVFLLPSFRIPDRQSGMDGPVRDSPSSTCLAGRFMEGHRPTLFIFLQSRNETPDLPQSSLSPLAIYQCDGKKVAEVAFSFTMCCEVGWTWLSSSTRLRVGQSMAEDQGLMLLYPLWGLKQQRTFPVL